MIAENTKLFNVEYLIAAIVKCAIKDYKAGLGSKKRLKSKNNETTKTIEKFFTSAYFESMTGLDGKWIVEEIKSRIESSKVPKKVMDTGKKKKTAESTKTAKQKGA